MMRAAVEADLPTILSLYADAELSPGGQVPIANARRIFKRMRDYPDYTVYVALEGEAVVGTFALLIMDNLANGGSPSGIVEDVAVASARRGQGIGKKMMDLARAKCRARGCYKLVLSSNMKRAQAHRFYESLGYEKHGFSFRLALPARSQQSSRQAKRSNLARNAPLTNPLSRAD